MMSDLIDPMVSIVIPVYNGVNYLKQAIDAAIGQTYPNVEIIVVNDGSDDDGATERIALAYGEKIRYFHKANGGVSSALNVGIREMKGDYFSWLSHDDLYAPTKVADAIALLRTHRVLGTECIAHTGGYFINAEGERISPFKVYFEEDKLYSGPEVVDVMTRKGTLNGCCMLIPKKAFDTVGTFNEDLRYSQDSLMWYQMFLAGCSLISDSKPNVMNRWHDGQVTKNRKDLFEKDMRYVAAVLSDPMAKTDPEHKIFYQYLKRMTRYTCRDVVNDMICYSKEKRVLSTGQMTRIKLFVATGHLRRMAVETAKAVLILESKIIKNRRRGKERRE